MEENNYCVYIHTTPSKKKYIGITKQKPQKRWRYGWGYANNVAFYNAIKNMVGKISNTKLFVAIYLNKKLVRWK